MTDVPVKKRSANDQNKALQAALRILSECAIQSEDPTEPKEILPTQHSVELHKIARYERFRYVHDRYGLGIHATYGIRPSGYLELYDVRFDSDRFTKEQAYDWLRKNNQRNAFLHKALEDLSENIDTPEDRDLTPKGGVARGELNAPPQPPVGENPLELPNDQVAKDSAPVDPDRGSGGETPTWEWDARIMKADEEKRIVYGVAYPLFPEGEGDSQHDRATAEEIEKMAHWFMLNSQHMDLHHKETLPLQKARPVESYIAPVDFDLTWNGHTEHVTQGSWVVATYIPDDDIWDNIKKGEINAYSIRGRGKRQPVTTPPA